MTQSRLSMGLATLGALALSLNLSAQVQDEGVKQVESLVKKASSTAEAITDVKMQLSKTMDVYNSMFLPDTKDVKGLYKKLQGEMESSEKRRAEVSKRNDEMKAEADTVFKSWADSTAAITNPDLRKRSEERLTKTKATYAEIQAAGQKALDVYNPMMNTLRDQVTYLGHDLNPTALASLKGDAAKINAQAQELGKRLDETVAATNKNIEALKPQ